MVKAMISRRVSIAASAALVVISYQYFAAAVPAHADQEFEIPTMHFLHGDPQQLFDYVHSKVDVAVTPVVSSTLGGELYGAPVGATDWNDGFFIEAGWARAVPGSVTAQGNPDCVGVACGFSNFGEGTSADNFTLHAAHQFNPGMSVWGKAWATTGPTTGVSTWKSAFGRGGWTVGVNGVDFDNTTHFAWIASGWEGVDHPGVGIGAPGQRHQYNMYSNVGFGEKWSWDDPCGSGTEIKPWCYSHVMSNHEGDNPCPTCPNPCPCGAGNCSSPCQCALCALFAPPRSNPPWTTGCTGFGGCLTMWIVTVP